MEKLAIREGIFYEGTANDLRAIYPSPVVSRVSCDFIGLHEDVVFREDSFDPVTRVRRGRFYLKSHSIDTWFVGRVDSGGYRPFHLNNPSAGNTWNPEVSYNAWHPIANIEDVNAHTVKIGDSGFETAWRVTDSERISIGHTLLTLRAISLAGVLPIVAEKIADKDGVTKDATRVRKALDALVDAFHKQQATPIVDVAREAMRVALTEWIGHQAQGKDLGSVIGELPAGKDVARWAASIVNRLHPRGKSAEHESQAQKGLSLRPVADEDAETSVHLVGMLLREFGWATQ